MAVLPAADSVQHTCKATVPAVRGDTAWIGCLKGKTKSGLLDATSGFWAEIATHVHVSSCKSSVGRQNCGST